MSAHLIRNPFIDGLRGLSVLGVILAHVVNYRYSDHFRVAPLHALIQTHASKMLLVENLLYKVSYPIGAIGIESLLTVTGYLAAISLLLEEETAPQVNVWGYYVRRIFRVMPAFYLYLLAIMLLRALGTVVLPDGALVRSGFFACLFSGEICYWWLAHTWTLSVAVLFYLAFPPVFILSRKQRVATLLTIFVALVAASFYVPELTGFTYVVAGVLLASSQDARSVIRRVTNPYTIAAAGLTAVVFHSGLQTSLLYHALDPILIAIVFLGTSSGIGPLARLGSLKTIQMVGIASYSIYLWQQLATAPWFLHGIDTGATSLYLDHGHRLFTVLIVVIAVSSYLFVERPMILLGRMLSDLIGRTGAVASAIQPTTDLGAATTPARSQENPPD